MEISKIYAHSLNFSEVKKRLRAYQKSSLQDMDAEGAARADRFLRSLERSKESSLLETFKSHQKKAGVGEVELFNAAFLTGFLTTSAAACAAVGAVHLLTPFIVGGHLGRITYREFQRQASSQFLLDAEKLNPAIANPREPDGGIGETSRLSFFEQLDKAVVATSSPQDKSQLIKARTTFAEVPGNDVQSMLQFTIKKQNSLYNRLRNGPVARPGDHTLLAEIARRVLPTRGGRSETAQASVSQT